MATPLLAALAVTVPVDGLALQGTLMLPEATGPVPGVVLVHGSGPQSRDQALPGQLNVGFGFEVPVFRELAEALVGEGYAVLRYDKRTCGKFNGCGDNAYPTPPSDITIGVFVDDAAAALAWLGARPEVDASKLVVVGHSQGATFVPALAHRVDGLAAGVMLAGNHRPIDAIVAQQLTDSRALMASLGAPAAVIEQTVAPLQQSVDQLAALRAGKGDGAPVMGAPAAFWTSWLTQADAVPELARTSKVPLLAVGGTMDTNIGVAELALWRETLKDPRHQVVQLEGISHALTRIDAPDVASITPAALGKHVDPSVIAAITAFLGDNVE